MPESKQKFTIGRARGNSMWPWIKEEDIIFIQPIKWRNIIPGDVIVYEIEKGGAWIAHRVIKKNNQELITKGDASLSLISKEKVPREKVIGKAIFIKKNNNKILPLKYTKLVYYSNRYFPFLWWLLYGVIKYKNPFVFITKALKKIQKLL